jgi:hypothetical protein
MKGVYACGLKADVQTATRRRVGIACALQDPEHRCGSGCGPVADRALALLSLFETQARQHSVVENRSPLDIRHRDRDVVQHWLPRFEQQLRLVMRLRARLCEVKHGLGAEAFSSKLEQNYRSSATSCPRPRGHRRDKRARLDVSDLSKCAFGAIPAFGGRRHRPPAVVSRKPRACSGPDHARPSRVPRRWRHRARRLPACQAAVAKARAVLRAPAPTRSASDGATVRPNPRTQFRARSAWCRCVATLAPLGRDPDPAVRGRGAVHLRWKRDTNSHAASEALRKSLLLPTTRAPIPGAPVPQLGSPNQQ